MNNYFASKSERLDEMGEFLVKCKLTGSSGRSRKSEYHLPLKEKLMASNLLTKKTQGPVSFLGEFY